MRRRVIDGEPRIDGRATDTVRPITVHTGILPRTHGSAVFTRGETQAIVTATLGTTRDAQMIDALQGDQTRSAFMLHYNFPPYCVGETGFVGSPKRREIGHGKLAKRGVQAVMPNDEDFPYTIRVVSEITESNGSSSMASVCGTSLALMDAGVPLKAPVAGIAMGLIKEEDGHAVLSDILGDEDHLGDMDFKVAGSRDGVTALQMDIKIQGITRDIMATALEQAKAGRLHILDEMGKVLDAARDDLSEHAPRFITVRINPEKIAAVIGKGGAVIRALTEETGATIDIGDDGVIKIASADRGRRRGGQAPHRADHRRHRGRHDLRGARAEADGLRRLRQHPARQGRPGAHQPDLRAARAERRRRAQRGADGQGQGARGRQAGAHPPEHEGGGGGGGSVGIGARHTACVHRGGVSRVRRGERFREC